MTKLYTEEEFIILCQKGDRLAQKNIYERYAPKMFTTCIRYVRNRMDAEEVLANTFFKVFSKISQYKSSGSFEGWIRRIAINECLTFLRTQKMMYIEADIEKANYEPDYNQIGSELLAEDLMLLIDKLPLGYRTVFNLYAIEGYTHQEIAEMLQISEGTSKSQLSRARALLQEYVLEMEKPLKRINL